MNPNIDKEYQNIFRELKEEKMDWNFEDFLKKPKKKPEETKVIPLQKKNLVVAIRNGIGWQQVWLRFWNDDVFNPDITEPTLKPLLLMKVILQKNQHKPTS